MSWIEIIYGCLLEIGSSIRVFARGQIISVFIAGTGIFATFLSSTHPSSNFPTLMSLFTYLLLSTYLVRICYSHLVSGTREIPERITFPLTWASLSSIKTSKPIYWYMAAALLDMEANYLVILAYNYTSITSIMLLDCFTIPSAMILSYYFLSYKYTYRHIFGAVVCVFGLAVIVIADSLTGKSKSLASPSNLFLGDMFCLIGSVLYASSNVLQEYIVKSHNREEYLGLLGGFGCIIALIQCMIVDYPGIKQTHWNYKIWLYIFGFVSCLFCCYTNASVFLINGDATLFNLSLLTSDVYAVLFSYFLYGEFVDCAYFIAFGLVILGLYIYHNEILPDSKATHEHDHPQNQEAINTSSKYILLQENSIPMNDSSHHPSK